MKFITHQQCITSLDILTCMWSCVVVLSDVGVDAELVFRTTMDTLFQSDTQNVTSSFATCSNKTRVVDLLNFAIELGKICEPLSFNIPKIPFFLIEDLLQVLTDNFISSQYFLNVSFVLCVRLQCQTLMNAFLIWEIIESKVDTLTLPVLFNRGNDWLCCYSVGQVWHMTPHVDVVSSCHLFRKIYHFANV